MTNQGSDDPKNNNSQSPNQDWLSKVTYVDDYGHSSIGHPPEIKKTKIVRIISILPVIFTAMFILIPIFEVVVIGMIIRPTAYFPIFTLLYWWPVGPILLIVSLIVYFVAKRATTKKNRNNQNSQNPNSDQLQ